MSALSAPFQPEEAFASRSAYKLLPFRFGALDQGRYIITNDVGEYVLLSRDELNALTRWTSGRNCSSRLALALRRSGSKRCARCV